MNKTWTSILRPAVVIATLALILVACGGAGTASPGASQAAPSTGGNGGEEVVVGHLNYYTGPFADVGPWFECVTDFTIDIINEDPALGREWRGVHDDLGTDGEATAARRLLEQEGAEILLNPAHEYASYRDYMLDYVQENNGPLMPSVHGGGIERAIGGVPDEPIFRGQPMDSAQASAGVLQVSESGAETVAIVASEIAGSQLMADAAALAAADLGLEVVLELDVQPELSTYQSEITRIADADPDAVLLFNQAEDGGTMIRQASEAGFSATWVGSSEWLGDAFVETATLDAIEQQDAVWVAGFTAAEGEGIDDYRARYEGSDCEEFAEAENSYNLAYHDVLVATALAVEAAGSYEADAWTPAMYEVTEGGTVCNTYAECVSLVREGEDIDYEGVSGTMQYTDTGVVSALFGIFEWTSTEAFDLVTELDGDRILELDSLGT